MGGCHDFGTAGTTASVKVLKLLCEVSLSQAIHPVFQKILAFQAQKKLLQCFPGATDHWLPMGK